MVHTCTIVSRTYFQKLNSMPSVMMSANNNSRSVNINVAVIRDFQRGEIEDDKSISGRVVQ